MVTLSNSRNSTTARTNHHPPPPSLKTNTPLVVETSCDAAMFRSIRQQCVCWTYHRRDRPSLLSTIHRVPTTIRSSMKIRCFRMIRIIIIIIIIILIIISFMGYYYDDSNFFYFDPYNPNNISLSSSFSDIRAQPTQEITRGNVVVDHREDQNHLRYHDTAAAADVVLDVVENNMTVVHSIYDLSQYHHHHHPTIPSSSTTHNLQSNNISAAVCYKALFGTSIDIGIILQWIGTYTLSFIASLCDVCCDPISQLHHRFFWFHPSIHSFVPTYNTKHNTSAYHHLLGFDHFYFFYRDEVTILPHWDQLVSLQSTIVTLIEWNDIGTLDSYYNQASGTEVQCLTQYAAHYDWVFIADIDEYLYLGEKDRTQDPSLVYHNNDNNNNDNHGGSTRINIEENGYIVTPFSSSSSSTDGSNDILTVKDLLYIYANMTYLSFGKRQYSLDHRTMHDVSDEDPTISNTMTHNNVRIQTVSTTTTNENDHGTTTTLRPDTTFMVSKYPYYMNSYFCHHRGHRRGAVICPIWRGRSKVMVRPQYHTFIDVHGTFGVDDLRKPHIHNGTIMHFHPDLYHIKEWPHIYSTHNVTIHSPPSSSDVPDGTNHNDATGNNNDYIDNYDNFTITNETEVSIHNIHTGYLPYYINDNDGMPEEVFLMKRDITLHDYFQKVMNLATNAYGYPIRMVPKQ